MMSSIRMISDVSSTERNAIGATVFWGTENIDKKSYECKKSM
jgi:hypothetical protein